LKKLDLTYPQFVIITGILWLKRSNEIVNQVKVINFTKMDKSVVSSVLKNLEKRDIVIREVDEKDTRAKKLALSEIGASKLERALSLIQKIDKVFFNENKIDLEFFNKCLLKLIKENGY
jgi:MarR family transcriptional regulator, temperature-dependent positive regulator of motility